MDIRGLQKLSLLDFPGHIACTVFTGGCTMRCPFCHNAGLVLRHNEEPLIPEHEVFAYLEKRRGVLDGVSITGGEPLMQPDIEGFIEKIKNMGFKVKLDTNGTYPGTLNKLMPLLDYVAMDIKNSPEKYAETVGVEKFDIKPVAESVELLKKGNVPYEFRTTVVRELHANDDFEKIGKWILGADNYFLQSFVDSGDLICKNLHGCTKDEMAAFRNIAANYVKNAEVRGI